jgi:hypothetical protein
MEWMIGFIIAGVLMVVEYFLCTRLKNPLWGGIIPLLLLAGSIYVFASGIITPETKNLFPFLLINVLFLGDWGTGRDKYKKLQQKEMNKMKARDIE